MQCPAQHTANGLAIALFDGFGKPLNVKAQLGNPALFFLSADAISHQKKRLQP
jgi:hypothetical protein